MDRHTLQKAVCAGTSGMQWVASADLREGAGKMGSQCGRSLDDFLGLHCVLCLFTPEKWKHLLENTGFQDPTALFTGPQTPNSPQACRQEVGCTRNICPHGRRPFRKEKEQTADMHSRTDEPRGCAKPKRPETGARTVLSVSGKPWKDT